MKYSLEDLKPRFELTDVGNCKRFEHLNKDKLMYMKPLKQWYVNVDGDWMVDTVGVFDVAMLELIDHVEEDKLLVTAIAETISRQMMEDDTGFERVRVQTTPHRIQTIKMYEYVDLIRDKVIDDIEKGRSVLQRHVRYNGAISLIKKSTVLQFNCRL